MEEQLLKKNNLKFDDDLINEISMNFMSQLKKIILLTFLLSLNLANENINKLDLSFSSNVNSWWIAKNNFGKNIKKNSIDFYYSKKSRKSNFKLNISNAFSKKDYLKLGESYVTYRVSENTNLKFGRYYRDFSAYMNDLLSSGHMLISNNARPMPKIGLKGEIFLKKRQDITFTWGIAHGEFKKNKYYSDAPFLHEKFLYIHLDINKNSRLNIGIAHEAIWAGTTTTLGSKNNPGNQPDSIKDFLKVFISADGPLIEGENHANALGAHSGIWDFSYIRSNGNKKITFYYQHYFEDTSSLRFANKIDGLWGVEISNPSKGSNFLLEYLDTSNCCIDPPYQSDNYYWNYQYTDGWKYENMILGNPFVNDEKFRDKIKLAHIGLDYQNFKLKVSKKINKEDAIKYKIAYKFPLMQANIECFYGSDEKNFDSGLIVSYNF